MLQLESHFRSAKWYFVQSWLSAVGFCPLMIELQKDKGKAFYGLESTLAWNSFGLLLGPSRPWLKMNRQVGQTSRPPGKWLLIVLLIRDCGLYEAEKLYTSPVPTKQIVTLGHEGNTWPMQCDKCWESQNGRWINTRLPFDAKQYKIILREKNNNRRTNGTRLNWGRTSKWNP